MALPESISIPDEIVMRKIYLIRDQKVMLDRDLAELYGIETKRLKEAVKRNIERFPDDFMLELTEDEYKNLRSKIVTSGFYTLFFREPEKMMNFC